MLKGAAPQVICEGTIAPDARVRETAFECLVKIAANYYEKLPAYMQDIFTLTHRAAKEDEEDVGKQAVEFWCTICEEELDLQEARPRTSRCNFLCTVHTARRQGKLCREEEQQ